MIYLSGLILLVLLYQSSHCTELSAHVSENGVHGSITFSAEPGGRVHISAKLDTQATWSWAIHHLPVDYAFLDDRCSFRKIGPVLFDLTGQLGQLSNQTVSIDTEVISLTGQEGIWSRSLLLTSNEGAKACATIIASGNSSAKVAEAIFFGESGISGTVLFLWYGSQTSTDAVIYTDLNYNNQRTRTRHNWRIYTTDILESDADKARSDCNSLQVVLLDMSERVGQVSCGEKQLLKDSHLPRTEIGNPLRNHYLVLLDNDHPETFLTCARLRPRPPVLLRAILSSHGVTGSISLSQDSLLSPTRVVLNISQVREPILGGFRIHDLPPSPYAPAGLCPGIGDVYNPTSKPIAADAALPGSESQDRYAVGDLSGKLGYVAEREWDSFLPLFGKQSVAHRSLVIYRNGESGVEEPWVCSTLTRYLWQKPEHKHPMITAEAVFRYPLVGRILMQQPEPTGETTILVEGLVYSDGSSQNTTRDHRWGIHVNEPGKDYFNWTARCVSAGPVFNPFMVNTTREAENVIGDLSARHQNIVISGAKKLIKESRLLFTDKLLLSGRHSVMGKSLVIFDDHGPKARGDRLACSKITGVFRRKAVARDWYGNGFPTNVSGKMEFLQQTGYGITDIEVTLEGLEGVSDYQIHMTPVMEILEFPCEENTLYGVYNPYNIPKNGIPNGTPDELRVGDLSGKFGVFDGLTPIQKVYQNDTNLSIFGPNSILGRSLVLHSKTGRRLACSTIERGYSPSEARELRGIASFHHPLGFASGYIRMTQLIHNDGSSSDTVLEVNLRHPGKQDRNITYHHDWAIYVNPVGVDATVKVLNTRCTAAGYIWNPHYTQLANPLDNELYKKECGPDSPLRCYVGDLSGRLGTIDIGNGRRVFSDANFPLEGKVSAMGRSIVILNKDRGGDKFACANIEPDYDTIKYVNVRRPPKFVVSQFLEDVREVMGIPDWFLTIDSRKTTLLHNGACIQLLIHFKGPQANKLEQDFSRLLSTGRLSEPSLYIVGYVPTKKRRSAISYKLCTTRGENPLSSAHLARPFHYLYIGTTVFLLIYRVFTFS